MRGLTAAERRAERLQTLTFLGLLADDVALATLHYPDMSDGEVQALKELDELLVSVASPEVQGQQLFPRRMSMNDPMVVLREAASLGGEEVASGSAPPDLDGLREPLDEVLSRKAEAAALEAVRDFAELLGRVTLLLAEQLANEKSADGWRLSRDS